jgi:hypothetical protein
VPEEGRLPDPALPHDGHRLGRPRSDPGDDPLDLPCRS